MNYFRNTLLLFLSFGIFASAFGQMTTKKEQRTYPEPHPLSTTPAKARRQVKFRKSYTIHQDKTAARKLILKPKYLKKLDKLMINSIKKGVFPGVEVFASVNGTIIYQKAFGRYTYNPNSKKVTDSTLFDIASVSKIMATLPSIMKLYDEGKISLNGTLGDYLPKLVDNTNKQNLQIKNLLMHQAGLIAWLPFYKATLDSSGMPSPKIYKHVAEKNYNIPVAKNLYMKNSYIDTMWKIIMNTPLKNKGKYAYSDLDFYFMQRIVQTLSQKGLSAFIQQNFYQPMGLHNILYNPWKVGRISDCAPTEDDDYFRYQLIHGYVHDQGAAMLGGVGGQAGIFASAKAVATMMQMYMNGGVYNHRRYLKRSTLLDFTEYHSNISRRAYGFDKPMKKGDRGPASYMCSKSAFGHQGFTGTCAWADPETGIVFVLLSNRVFPTAKNWLITKLDTRTIAQGYIYKALGYKKP